MYIGHVINSCLFSKLPLIV